MMTTGPLAKRLLSFGQFPSLFRQDGFLEADAESPPGFFASSSSKPSKFFLVDIFVNLEHIERVAGVFKDGVLEKCKRRSKYYA